MVVCRNLTKQREAGEFEYDDGRVVAVPTLEPTRVDWLAWTLLPLEAVEAGVRLCQAARWSIEDNSQIYAAIGYTWPSGDGTAEMLAGSPIEGKQKKKKKGPTKKKQKKKGKQGAEKDEKGDGDDKTPWFTRPPGINDNDWDD